MIAAVSLEMVEMVIEIEDMDVCTSKGMVVIKEAMTEKAEISEAAKSVKETRVPRLSNSIDRNEMNAVSVMVKVKAMSESTCGEQSQAHHQAENQRRNKFAHLGHCVVLTFYPYSSAI
jgi:hypothetical protein